MEERGGKQKSWVEGNRPISDQSTNVNGWSLGCPLLSCPVQLAPLKDNRVSLLHQNHQCTI